MRTAVTRPVAAALSALALAACDAQTGDDYLGEPLADLHGVVRNEGSGRPTTCA